MNLTIEFFLRSVSVIAGISVAVVAFVVVLMGVVACLMMRKNSRSSAQESSSVSRVRASKRMSGTGRRSAILGSHELHRSKLVDVVGV